MPDVTQLMAYEDGQLDDSETIQLFAGLVKSGVAWSLQGSYGRTAASLIDQGYLSPTGDVLRDA